jgi:hypothetical protein
MLAWLLMHGHGGAKDEKAAIALFMSVAESHDAARETELMAKKWKFASLVR